ncbi:MAG: hypothetical protein C6Y22_19070 [Hapalosiphonaceae cyanobacterium JJU2]|nr:MAG: hypothetical protein C6Y22_19070 [Hapalosiphonaceae cyanobacterium JJU2]
MKIYFHKSDSEVVTHQIDNLEKLIEIIFSNQENEPLFIDIDNSHYSIQVIPEAEKDYELKLPVIYYYYCEQLDEKPISKFPWEKGVPYRELILTKIKDMEYFINEYQGSQYIIDIKNLAFVIRKVQ